MGDEKRPYMILPTWHKGHIRSLAIVDRSGAVVKTRHNKDSGSAECDMRMLNDAHEAGWNAAMAKVEADAKKNPPHTPVDWYPGRWG